MPIFNISLAVLQRTYRLRASEKKDLFKNLIEAVGKGEKAWEQGDFLKSIFSYSI